ncbi:MAG: ERF family protein, partial [Patescibacteria group bacterium]|nr:ERF family protein [Patescibacteria group bacterium]
MAKKTKQETALAPAAEKIMTLSPEMLISQAIEKGTDVGTMEKLLAMRRELKAEWSREQYFKAMADFQSECPVIPKSKEGGRTNAGKVAYHYAPLDVIVFKTKDLIQKHGFSYAIKSETTDSGVKVTCIVNHVAGHQEQSEVEMPYGTKTNVMSETQKVAATLTFAKRYAFQNAFGILTGDEDNEDKVAENDRPEQSTQKPRTKFDELMDKLPRVRKDQLDIFNQKVQESVQYT